MGGSYLINLEEGTNEIKITPLRSLETGKNLLNSKYE